MLNKLTLLTFTLLCAVNLQAMDLAEKSATQPAGQVETKRQYDEEATKELKTLIESVHDKLDDDFDAEAFTLQLQDLIKRGANIDAPVKIRSDAIDRSIIHPSILVKAVAESPIPILISILLNVRANPFIADDEGLNALQLATEGIALHRQVMKDRAPIVKAFPDWHTHKELYEDAKKTVGQYRTIIPLLKEAMQQWAPPAPPAPRPVAAPVTAGNTPQTTTDTTPKE